MPDLNLIGFAFGLSFILGLFLRISELSYVAWSAGSAYTGFVFAGGESVSGNEGYWEGGVILIASVDDSGICWIEEEESFWTQDLRRCIEAWRRWGGGL